MHNLLESESLFSWIVLFIRHNPKPAIPAELEHLGANSEWEQKSQNATYHFHPIKQNLTNTVLPLIAASCLSPNVQPLWVDGKLLIHKATEGNVPAIYDVGIPYRLPGILIQTAGIPRMTSHYN